MADDGDTLSPDEMTGWLRQEIRDLTKAAELRMRDAMDFVTAYTAGKLSPEEANERLRIYMDRWGDSPLPGVAVADGMTDKQILQGIDDALPTELRGRHAQRVRKQPGGRDRQP